MEACGSIETPFVFISDPLHSQRVIRDCPPNCDKNESSSALLTHDWEIVPLSLFFMFSLLWFPPLPNDWFAKNQQDLSAGMCGEGTERGAVEAF